MKKTTSIVSVLTLALSLGAVAQTQKTHTSSDGVLKERTCGTMENYEYLKQTRPGYEKDAAEYAKMIEKYLDANKNTLKASGTNQTTSVITIPVVIHILYKTAVQNISDAQATSQFAVLNNDFQRLNADTALGAAFYGVAGRVNFQFFP